YGVPVVVAINRFLTDSDEELSAIEDYCTQRGADFALSEVFAKGGRGGMALAEKIVAACDTPSHFAPIYDSKAGTIESKLETIAKTIYGAAEVAYTPVARKAMKDIAALGGDTLPICIAKTQYSLSDDPTALGCPTGFTLTVRDLRLSNGAGFVVALTGDIMTMPGLPKAPAASVIDVDENGEILGLF
ncbi:MAG: formate--tetrahydrofolate ligase, partial [Angelakisella sp.]